MYKISQFLRNTRKTGTVSTLSPDSQRFQFLVTQTAKITLAGLDVDQIMSQSYFSLKVFNCFWHKVYFFLLKENDAVKLSLNTYFLCVLHCALIVKHNSYLQVLEPHSSPLSLKTFIFLSTPLSSSYLKHTTNTQVWHSPLLGLLVNITLKYQLLVCHCHQMPWGDSWMWLLWNIAHIMWFICKETPRNCTSSA